MFFCLRVIVDVHCYGELGWQILTLIEVKVVFWKKINIVKYKTSPLRVVFECLHKTDVEQVGSIELETFVGLDQIDAVVDVLFREELVDIAHKRAQILRSIPVRNNDGHSVATQHLHFIPTVGIFCYVRIPFATKSNI